MTFVNCQIINFVSTHRKSIYLNGAIYQVSVFKILSFTTIYSYSLPKNIIYKLDNLL